MGEITLELRLVFHVPEEGLTIQGLIRGLKAGAPEIHGAILSTLMQGLEDRLIAQMLQTHPGRYRRNGRQSKPRQLRCSLGTVPYRFAQLVDTQDQRTVLPLGEALQIPAYDHFLDEALEPAIGLSVHVSYRRATQEVERLQGQVMSHTTVHRRLQAVADRQSPFGALTERPFRFLVVDGTKVRLQGPRGEDLGQAEMRWALASEGPGHRFEPVGFWIDRDWAAIRTDLEARLDYPTLEILFSDGGPGIEGHLVRPGMQHQRCQWHGKHSFPYLLYADGFKKSAQGPLVAQLQAIPALRMTRADLENLRPADRPAVAQMLAKTEQGFQGLLHALDPGRYPQARSYIQNLMEPVTTFLRWWLQTGEAIPLTTSAIESAFSQVSNRIKRVGKRWSEQGLLNWLKVTFYKIFKPELWAQIWGHNLQEIPRIRLISIQASYAWSGAIT